MTSILFPPVPTSVARGTVTVADGTTLHYYRSGSPDAPTLLLVPGWAFSAEVFVHQLTGLSADFDVIALDPRGQGESDKPLVGNSFAQRGDDLAEVIAQLDLDDVTLVGWSFGVLDVLSSVQAHGDDRIRSFVLVDEPPRVVFDPSDAAEWGEAALSPDGLPAFLQFVARDYSGFAAYIATHAIGLADDVAPDDAERVRVLELVASTPEHIGIITAADGLSSDYSAVAIDIAARKPVLFYARDEWVDDARRWVSANLPDARFEQFAHHASFAIEPAAFNERVRRFVRE